MIKTFKRAYRFCLRKCEESETEVAAQFWLTLVALLITPDLLHTKWILWRNPQIRAEFEAGLLNNFEE